MDTLLQETVRDSQVLSNAAAEPRQLGVAATGDGEHCFLVWAPTPEQVELHLVAPDDRTVPMHPRGRGYWSVNIPALSPGTRYFYRLDGEDRPDPASRYQPEDVHGPTEILEECDWQDSPGWKGSVLSDYIFHEIHVGTFTPEGTLDAIIPCLDRLADLGITAIELMPLAEFPGSRNWGYDGVHPFAVEQAYGGVHALRRLVRACHERGLAVVLDVVYNHLGPEGNYLREFGPYFTSQYNTPWGDAINYDGPRSDEVRRFFLENAIYWIAECGVDALRLDAVHAIFDRSAYSFLEELSDAIARKAAELGRRVYLIAESDLNDARLIRPKESGGTGLHAQWADDFHHCLHALLTGEKTGYYADYGDLQQLAAVYRGGWCYSGQYSRTRERRFGNSPEGLQADQFVVCTQNHDQVGNRMLGERLVHLVGAEKARLAAGAMMLSPFLPLLFMGEEYGEPAPFQYHVSHSDPDLVAAVRKGRKEEFSGFHHEGEPPDPLERETFFRSKLQQHLAGFGDGAAMHRYYKELIRLRKTHPALRATSKEQIIVECFEAERIVLVRRFHAEGVAFLLLHFGSDSRIFSVRLPRGRWRKAIDSADESWMNRGISDTNDQIASDGEGQEIPLAILPYSCILLLQ